jgi:hypothetical protein
MTTDNNLHQTYLKDCNCSDDGIIIKDGAAVCRWCRTPYAKGGCMAYEEKHFQQKPKEWEILSVIDGVKNGIDETGLVAAVNPSDTYSWMKSGVKIHSVRRLRDNEIFTVDEVTGQGRVTGFQTEGNELFAECENGLRYVYLSNLTKTAKQPLFTTEDGKEVYKGDDVFFVRDDFSSGCAKAGVCAKWGNAMIIYFSTKEAAEEYVLMNKPLLSLNDLLYAWGGGAAVNIIASSPLFSNFKQLAKQKLNQ